MSACLCHMSHVYVRIHKESRLLDACIAAEFQFGIEAACRCRVHDFAARNRAWWFKCVARSIGQATGRVQWNRAGQRWWYVACLFWVQFGLTYQYNEKDLRTWQYQSLMYSNVCEGSFDVSMVVCLVSLILSSFWKPSEVQAHLRSELLTSRAEKRQVPIEIIGKASLHADECTAERSNIVGGVVHYRNTGRLLFCLHKGMSLFH